jgi:hypothetical protein
MPFRNPGKTAFAVILGLAAVTGALFYVFSGIATPKPGTDTPASDQELPPPAISGNASGQNETAIAGQQSPQ